MPNSTSVDSMRNLLTSNDHPTGHVSTPTPADTSGSAAPSDLDQLLACDEVSVVLLAPDLRITRIAAAAQRLLGLNRAKPAQNLGDLAESVRCPELLTDARQVLDTGEAVSRSVLLPQGQTHLVLRFYLRRSNAAEQGGLLVSVVDTTERWRANSLAAHLAAIVKYSDDAILSKDLNGVITSWNRGAERLFGYTAEETIGRSVTLLIPQGMPDEEPGILDRIRRGEAIDHYQTVRVCKDGSLVNVSLCVSPVLDSDGRVVGASKIARNVTLEKQAQHQREVLINELNHRVKNTLATVQSIAYQSLRFAPTMEAFAEAFDARLLALSKTQDLLTSGNWIRASLRDLVSNELAPYRSEVNRVILTGNDLQLKPQLLTAVGMLIHELTTNAVKYGALSIPGGKVDVSWQTEVVASVDRLRLFWEELDGPPITRQPTRKGMGSRLLETLAATLGGAVDLQYAPTGVSCVIDVPWTSEESST
ncbi:MAG: HWE histidine kinase domain-containing protein [Rhodanobacter sp.]